MDNKLFDQFLKDLKDENLTVHEALQLFIHWIETKHPEKKDVIRHIDQNWTTVIPEVKALTGNRFHLKERPKGVEIKHG